VAFKISDKSITIILSFILGVAIVLRLSSLQFLYLHPDEIITLGTVERIINTGSLDTNWKLSPLPDMFRYPQYNFSSYILSSAFVLKLVHTLAASPAWENLAILRFYSTLLGILSIGLIFLVGRNLFNQKTGLYAACLAAFAPLLYQDSLYARPETFVTVLTLLYVYILSQGKIQPAIRIFAASFILGILIATKISLVALAPMIVLPLTSDQSIKEPLNQELSKNPGILLYLKESLVNAFKYAPIIVLGCLVGFIAGAPYAIPNFQDYIFGFSALKSQYTTGHWPHGLYDGSIIERLAYSINYFTSTLGYPLFIFSFWGAVIALRQKRFREVFIFIFILIFALRFSTYPVFFERNFSHLLPFFILFCAFAMDQLLEYFSLLRREGSKDSIRTIFLLLLMGLVLYPGLLTTGKIRFLEITARHTDRVEVARLSLENQYNTQAIQLDWPQNYEILTAKLGEETCKPSLVQVPWPEDRYSIQVVEEFKEQDGYQEVGRVPSLFNRVPPSTLHTYFTPTMIFLYKEECTSG
jgi:hypothetical protein